MNLFIPKIIFIVPYRDRPTHKFFFSQYITSILKQNNYEIYFSHQFDKRAFNRGACKNIGFLAIKKKYPDYYKNFTFVFNDIDTIPFKDILDYETQEGIVKHFYGFEYALGGIVAIKGIDFEKINGFPNYWGWGMEDTVLQTRCLKNNIIINRDLFFTIGSPEIIHLFDGVSRIINKKDSKRAIIDDGLEGLKSLKQISFNILKESQNLQDNIDIIEHNLIFIINIHYFKCSYFHDQETFFDYDLREPMKNIQTTERIKPINSLFISDWKNIPFYPNQEQKNEMINKYGKDKTDFLIQNGLKNTNSNSNSNQTQNFNSNSNFNKNNIKTNYFLNLGIKGIKKM